MITEKRLLELIESLESYNVEKTTSTKDVGKFCKAICAFANDYPNSGKPGYLLIGVNDDGKLSHLRITDELNKEISGLRTDGNILPIPQMSVGNFRFSEGDVLVVEVLPSKDAPVRYEGRTWIRNGARKGIATFEEEQRLAERRVSSNKSFDASPCLESSIEDLDLNLIMSLYMPNILSEDILSIDSRNIKDKLASVKLFDKAHDCPTNAAIILFGINPTRFIPGAYVQYVEFKGKDNASAVVNEKIFKGNLISILNDTKTFTDLAVIKTKPIRASIFEEVPQSNYPSWAIRELLMNAFMHRDYFSNAPIRYYQYSDRIDIINPGGLYGCVNADNFPNANDYRNPTIAEAMKALGFVNRFNSGIARVQKELSDNGNGIAIFNVEDISRFCVKVGTAVFRTTKSTGEILSDITVGYNSEPKTSGILRDCGTNYEMESIISDLSSRSLIMLSCCHHEDLSRKELFDLIGLSSQTNNVKVHLDPLIENGLLVRTEKSIKSKNQKYHLTQKGYELLTYLSYKNHQVHSYDLM